MQRRIAAACLHYGISGREIAGRLFVDSGRNSGIVIAKMDRNAVVIAEPVVEALTETDHHHHIKLVRWIRWCPCHHVPENDNGAM